MEKIREAIDHHPWRCAFFYPCFFTIIVTFSTSLLSEVFEELVILYLFVLLPPLWILYGLIVSKRRLPYAIMLIIFIGIPLTMMVAREGYESSAKINHTKVLHSQIVEYITQELQKCNSVETSIMEDQLSCVSITPEKTISALLNVNKIAEYVELNKYKNAYKHEAKPLRNSNSNTNDEDVGYVNLSASGTNIIIKTCFKTPCNKEANRQSSTVSIK